MIITNDCDLYHAIYTEEAATEEDNSDSDTWFQAMREHVENCENCKKLRDVDEFCEEGIKLLNSGPYGEIPVI